MVKCPKCGIKGDNYTIVETLDRDFDGDRMIEINKVECEECKHQFLVRDIYKIKYEYSTNIVFSAD
jgi:DNA-directed RNA polymerase subunit RPC12/RpoP